MLSCREMSEQASELLEGRAPGVRRAAAWLHLAMCRHCRRYFRQMRLTIETLRRAGPTRPPFDPERVLKGIDDAAPR
jgi:predicted anti-sigma-YlaC factor YlaD